MTTERVSHAIQDPWPYRFSFARRLRGLRAPRHLVAVLLKRSGLAPWFTMTTPDGVKLRFFPSSLSTAIWEKRDKSGPDRQFLRRYLRPGDCFVDVGANIGHLTVTAAKAIGPTGRAIAFEANPRVFGYLKHNVGLNKLMNVAVHNFAVGSGEAAVDVLECPGDDSQSCIAHGEGATPVRMVRLDTILEQEERIALLKIDVEGYEKFVIEGASKILPRVECVYFESYVNNYSRYGYACSTLLAILEKAGFRVYRLVGGHCARLSHDVDLSSECENLIAVRNEHDFFARTAYGY